MKSFVSLLVTACVLWVGVQPVSARDELPSVTTDGLVRVKGSEMNVVYAAEGIDLGIYDKVLFTEVAVAFKKNWQRDQNRFDSFKVRDRDVQRIRTELAELFKDVFNEQLAADGHVLASAPAEDVLVVRPAIFNLDVTAPSTSGPSRVYQFSESAGEMSLYLELYDSLTGDILLKAIDRKRDRSGTGMSWNTSISNRVAAEKMLKGWAKLLSSALSEAQEAHKNAD
jgi:hypothetical protein